MLKIWKITTLLLLLVSFAGIAFSTSREQVYEYRTAGVEKIVLKSSFGDLNVKSWNEDYVYMKIKKWVNGVGDHERFLDDAVLVESFFEGVLTLDQRFPNSFTNLAMSFGVKIDMMIPDGYDEKFEIKNSFGDVVVENMNSAFVIRNSNGNINVSDLYSDLEIENSFGNISLYNISGELSVDNSNGDVRLENTKEGILTQKTFVKNSFGSVILNRVNGDTEIKNSSGEIRVRDLAGNLKVKNSFDKVEAFNVSGKVDIDSGNGAVKVINSLNGVKVKNSFGNIELNKVSGDIYIDNGNGDIDVNVVDNEGFFKGKIENSFGYVKLNGFTGDMYIKNGNGKIVLDNFSGIIDAKTSFGTIEMKNSELNDGDHNLKTSNDSIVVNAKMPDNGKAYFETSFGDIRVYVDNNAKFNLNTKTSFGDVSVRDLMIMEDRNGKRLINGGGEFDLSLKTSSGDIEVSGK